MVWIALAIYVAEAVWAFLVSMEVVKTVARKRWLAIVYCLAARTISWTVLYVVANHQWNVNLMVASTLGDATGVFLAASRKPKKRVVRRRKEPIPAWFWVLSFSPNETTNTIVDEKS